jgi:hypothetical protein
LYTGTKEQVSLLKGTDREVSSHKIDGKRPFGTNLLWMDNKVYILLEERRLFLYVLFVLSRTAECAQP